MKQKKKEPKIAVCKHCGEKMTKFYCFSDKTPYQQLRCTQCGAETAKRTIEYNERGNLEKKGGRVLND